MMPATGEPGTFAAMTAPEAHPGFAAIVYDDSLRDANPRFQVDAVAAYFADALRDTYDYDRLPGRPSLNELADWADTLGDRTEDSAVRQLAGTIREARHLAD